MHVHDIKCDYEHCNQRRNGDEKNWWVLVSSFLIEANAPIVSIYVMTERHAANEEPSEIDNEQHVCSIDHAVKLAARMMEWRTQAAQAAQTVAHNEATILKMEKSD